MQHQQVMIRKLFTEQPLAKQRDYTPGVFSFNAGRGRCPTCSGNGFELAFFNQLHSEIEDLKQHGVEELRFTGTRRCVKLLRGAEKWNRPCEKLHNEIITFLGTHGHSTLPDTKEIRVDLT